MRITESQLRKIVKKLVNEAGMHHEIGSPHEFPIESKDDFLDDVMNDYLEGGRENVNYRTLMMASQFYGRGPTGRSSLIRELTKALGDDGSAEDILYMADVAYDDQ